MRKVPGPQQGADIWRKGLALLRGFDHLFLSLVREAIQFFSSQDGWDDADKYRATYLAIGVVVSNPLEGEQRGIKSENNAPVTSDEIRMAWPPVRWW